MGELLRERGLVCATAESCTGGLIGHLITEVPGSSDYFAGGAIVYSYAAKEALVGVDHDTFLREGAVSATVAEQMAQGALRRLCGRRGRGRDGDCRPRRRTAGQAVGHGLSACERSRRLRDTANGTSGRATAAAISC